MSYKISFGNTYTKKGIVAFALSVCGLIIFSGMLGYIEIVMVDTFEQIQHGNNPLLAILAETFLSLNYCCHNQKGYFLGVHLYCIYGSGVISSVKGSSSQNLTFQR